MCTRICGRTPTKVRGQPSTDSWELRTWRGQRRHRCRSHAVFPTTWTRAEPVTRIIGGAAGGRRIKAPAGDRTRPTSDRVREALFSAVDAALGSLHGLRFLDVYAGSGAVGLEARSRGAGVVTLVEHDRRAAGPIPANARCPRFRGRGVLPPDLE